MGLGLSGIGDTIFGSSPDVKTDRRSTLRKSQKKGIDALIPQLFDLVGSAEGDAPQLSALEQELLGRAREFADNPPALFNEAQGALTDILNDDELDIDEFFRTNIADPLREELQQDFDAIGNRFGGRFFGGERVEAEGRTRDRFIDTLGRERARVALEQGNFQTDAKLRALGLAPEIANLETDFLKDLFGFAGIERQQRQGELDLAQSRMNQLLSLLGQPTADTFGTSTGTEGIFGPLAGAAGLAIGAFAASSRDFKHDNAPAPDVLDKIEALDIDTWRYRDEMGLGDDTHLGPYAEQFQELFGLGDGKTIPMVDSSGIALKGVQELSQKVTILLEKMGIDEDKLEAA